MKEKMFSQEAWVCMLKALEAFVGSVSDIGDSWWCPNCGTTDCTYDGRCTGCGTSIEDSQPDTSLIDAAKQAIAKAYGETP